MFHWYTKEGLLLTPGLPGLEVTEERIETKRDHKLTIIEYRYYVDVSLEHLLANYAVSSRNRPDRG